LLPTLLALGVVAAPLPDVLASELARSMEVLSKQPEPPYYVSLGAEEVQSRHLSATAGTLDERRKEHWRWLDADVRVGSPELDNTHPLRGMSAWRQEGRGGARIPVTDEPEHAVRHAIWHIVDRRYRDAAEAVVMVRSNVHVKAEEEHRAPDFELRTAARGEQEIPGLDVDLDAWESLLVELSDRLDADPAVERSGAYLKASRSVKTFVDTEGARLVHGRTAVRVRLDATTTTPDGDPIYAQRIFDAHAAAGLPDAAALTAAADDVRKRLHALAAAPRGQPYSGPVLLRGKASAVFFHEVLGHRVEGHRQKRDDEGKTFTEYVGRSILPELVDVLDDPTLARSAGSDLNGHYAFDDEGVPAARVPIVERGVLKGFLMARSPIQGSPHSNGHGRRSVGKRAVSRMGNLVVQVREGRPLAELRKRLVDEVERRGLPYGVIVDEIDGGFTYTGREMANAFSVKAAWAWRVHPDGRPDELVRGVDLVGTPLVAFSNLVAAGDDPAVFNGSCGAESGWVPVSAVSPSLLFSALEFQLQEKGEERPPLLGKPGRAP